MYIYIYIYTYILFYKSAPDRSTFYHFSLKIALFLFWKVARYRILYDIANWNSFFKSGKGIASPIN